MFFADAREDVLRACGKIEKFYETKKDSGNLSAVSNELKKQSKKILTKSKEL